MSDTKEKDCSLHYNLSLTRVFSAGLRTILLTKYRGPSVSEGDQVTANLQFFIFSVQAPTLLFRPNNAQMYCWILELQ